jgi:hydroxymethylpyrimidine pyrophosphatase-like HAD family hydrolase
MKLIKSLIAVDLDGTLLDDDGNISDYTVSIFKKCKAKGILVAFVTARTKESLKKYEDLLEPDIVIAECGLFVRIYNTIYREITTSDNDTIMLTKNIDKFYGIEKVTNHLHIPLSDVVAFGDDAIDRGMIKKCGIGVAVGNANEELKAVADYICGDNNHDGVARWIEENLLTRLYI